MLEVFAVLILETGIIKNCKNLSEVIGIGRYEGGICGFCWNGSIYDCVNESKVQGRTQVGGITGASNNR